MWRKSRRRITQMRRPCLLLPDEGDAGKYSHPVSIQLPELLTEADQKSLKVEGHEPVRWELFGDLLAEIGEYQVRAVELRRDGPSEDGLAPRNGLITAAVLAAWSVLLVAAVKKSTMRVWPVKVGAYTMGTFFKSLPIGSQIRIVLDSDDLTEAFKHWSWLMEQPQPDPRVYMSVE
jgi:hypothetical protein